MFIAAVGLPSTDSDTYWQLAMGRWMLDHGAFVREDVFSSTVAGAPVGIGEWLAQLAFAGAFELAGWAGVVVLRAALVATAAFFVTRLARRGGAPWFISLPLVIAALLVSKITWTDRPHLFTLALFPMLLDLLVDLRLGFSRRLVVLPPLILVWSLLHGGYLLGLALVAIFAAHALLTAPRRAAPIALVTVICALAPFVNPAPHEVAGAARDAFFAPPRFLDEFRPPDVLTPAGALFAGFVLLAVGTALLRGGTLVDAMLLAPLLYLAFTAQRHMPFFCFAAAGFIGARLASLVPPGRFALPSPVHAPIAAALVIAAVASITTAPTSPDERLYPSGALATLRDGRGVLLNEYDWGGYLIFNAPERPVFIDGRYYPYVARVLEDYRALVGLRPAWRELLERYRVDEVLLRPERPLVVALREDGWRVRASDEGGRWIVLSRP